MPPSLPEAPEAGLAATSALLRQPAARLDPTSPLAAPGAVLLLSCYELGHQPFTIASPWAQLERAGFGVAGIDAALDPVSDAAFAGARLVAISVPMHTALRLGAALAARVRAANPAAHVCLFGLYASMNARYLLEEGVADSVIGGEFESALVGLASALARRLDTPRETEPVPGVTTRRTPGFDTPSATLLSSAAVLRRLAFEVPRRQDLPELDRYAKLLGPAPGEERVVGYVEASRGCLHECLHCPITPVYGGRFFVVPKDIVIADAAQQIARGARHITFGDPDFMNGPSHSMSIARELHARFPEVTFDVTVKVEHILRHRERFPELAALGCVFVVSAVESLSERVLLELAKGHTANDVLDAVAITRAAGIALRPSLVAFTPWTTLDDYCALSDFVVEQRLVDNVDPIQLAIRLLIPPSSALLRKAEPRPWLGPMTPGEFGHVWTHPDPRMDRLHADVSRLVERATSAAEDAAVTFESIRRLAYEAAGRPAPAPIAMDARPFVPRLTEPWFCCAEPNREQLAQVTGCSEAAKGCCG